MRILHVVPTYLPAVRYGGPIHSVHGLCKGLAARAHDVHVFTTNVDGPGTSPVPLGEPVELDRVNVWYFTCGAGRRLYRSPQMADALAQRMAGFDVAHLHSAFLWPTLAAARAARRANVPYVLAPRGMLVADLIRRKSWLAKTLWIEMFERSNIAHASAVHVTSDVEAADLQHLGLKTGHVVVVRNGIDMPPSATSAGLTANRGRSMVLSLGRINWKKGLDRLVRAFAHVPEAELVIAGNDEESYTPRLEAIARELGLSHRVRFVGPVHGDAKWELMRGASVFVLASYSENFGNVVLEAMACGVPVVVTPEVGLAGEVAAAGAGVVSQGEPGMLGGAIASLLGDARRRSVLGEAGMRTAQERFSWASVAEQFEKIYRACKNNAPASDRGC